jgi:DNA-binding MarR family transcriptional regulator
VTDASRAEGPDDDLLQALILLKRALAAKTVGVDPGVHQVLGSLVASGPMRQGAVAEQLCLDASTVSRHVRTLVGQGLVEVARDPEDGRAAVLTSTEAGRAFMAERAAAHRARLAAATEDFTAEERATLVRLLNRLAANIGELQETP